MIRRLGSLAACVTLLFAGCGGGGGGGGFPVTSFRHVTTLANVAGNSTYIDHPLLNGNPSAVVIACHNLASGGPAQYDDQTYGVWYEAATAMWLIFHQSGAAMPLGLEWNVNILGADTNVFVHTADAANTGGGITFLDHPALNGNSSVRLVATQNWNPPGSFGVFNNEVIGTYYDSGPARWAIYNESLGAMPLGAAFNVCVPPTGNTFVHTSSAGNTGLNLTTMTHALKTDNPTANCAYLHVLSGSGSEFDRNTGLWFDGLYWTIYTEDNSAFPVARSFFVWRP